MGRGHSQAAEKALERHPRSRTDLAIEEIHRRSQDGSGVAIVSLEYVQQVEERWGQDHHLARAARRAYQTNPIVRVED